MAQPDQPLGTDLTFGIGVIGHRPDRLQAADLPMLEKVVAGVIATVQDLARKFAGRQIVILSPLAEGADQIVAKAGLAANCRLFCPTPFPLAEYEKDFPVETGARAGFHALLAQARAANGLTLAELDGSREAPGAAYGTAGRVVMRGSDLLLAIWDGQKPKGEGGTVQTLQEALAENIPVLWIDAESPHALQILGNVREFPTFSDTRRAEVVQSPASSLTALLESLMASASTGNSP